MQSVCLTRLQLHDIVLYGRRPHRVDLVNDCRARLVPLTRPVREYIPQTGRNAGVPQQYEENARGENISPNSELAVIGRWDPIAQRAVLFNGRAGMLPPQNPPLKSEISNLKSHSDPGEQGMLL